MRSAWGSRRSISYSIKSKGMGGDSVRITRAAWRHTMQNRVAVNLRKEIMENIDEKLNATITRISTEAIDRQEEIRKYVDRSTDKVSKKTYEERKRLRKLIGDNKYRLREYDSRFHKARLRLKYCRFDLKIGSDDSGTRFFYPVYNSYQHVAFVTNVHTARPSARTRVRMLRLDSGWNILVSGWSGVEGDWMEVAVLFLRGSSIRNKDTYNLPKGFQTANELISYDEICYPR